MVDAILGLFGGTGQAAKGRKRGTRERVCRDCGRVEQVRQDNTSDRCRFCSASANGGKAKGSTRTEREEVACEGCGGRFVALVTQARKFCSPTCRKTARSVERTCKECGKAFRRARSTVEANGGNFCGRPCYHRWLCRTDHDPRRGAGWKQARALAISRSPFCAVCGTRKRLQVHHIVPYRLTRDNGQENLVPLCVKHHRFVETIFVGLEPLFGPDFGLLQLVLRSQIRERQAATRARLVEFLRAAIGGNPAAGHAPAYRLPPT